MGEADNSAEVWEKSFDSCIVPMLISREELPQISVHVTRKCREQLTSPHNFDRAMLRARILEEKGRFRVWKSGETEKGGERVKSVEKTLQSAIARKDRAVVVRSRRTYMKRPRELSNYRSPRERELCFATIHSHRLTPLGPSTPDYTSKATTPHSCHPPFL